MGYLPGYHYRHHWASRATNSRISSHYTSSPIFPALPDLRVSRRPHPSARIAIIPRRIQKMANPSSGRNCHY
jgi:hypothetical protein